MSTKLLEMKGEPCANYDNEGFKQFVVKPSYRRDQTFSANNTIAGAVAGSTNECTLDFNTDFTNSGLHGLLDDLIFEEDFTNASGDSTVTFPNAWRRFANFQLFWEGVEVDPTLTNADALGLRYDSYLRDKMKTAHEFYADAQRNFNVTGSTLPALVVSNSGTSLGRTSLLNLYPFLKNIHTTQLGKLRVKWSYQPNLATTGAVGDFCVSGTTTNNYATLQVSNTQIRAIINTEPDSRLIVSNPMKNKIWVKNYDILSKTVAFNTANTDIVRFVTRSEYAEHDNVIGAYIWAESPDNRSAYNSANACVRATLPETICYKVLFGQQVHYDHSVATTNLIDRRRLMNDNQVANWSHPFLQDTLASNNLNKYLIYATYLDFTNVKTHEDHEQSLTGINSKAPLEIVVSCGSTGVDADNTRVYCALVYLTCIDFDTPNGKPVRRIEPIQKVLNEPLRNNNKKTILATYK